MLVHVESMLSFVFIQFDIPSSFGFNIVLTANKPVNFTRISKQKIQMIDWHLCSSKQKKL